MIITGGMGDIGSSFIKFADSKFIIESISRSNNYNIENTELILQKSVSADVFINLAHYKFNQSILCHTMYKLWCDKKEKLILNIGSCAGKGRRFNSSPHKDMWFYETQKVSLYNTFEQCLQHHIVNNKQTCKVKMLTIGPVQGKIHDSSKTSLTCETVAKHMIELIENDQLYESTLI